MKTIEQNISRIANALEVIAEKCNGQLQLGNPVPTVPTPEPKPKRKRAAVKTDKPSALRIKMRDVAAAAVNQGWKGKEALGMVLDMNSVESVAHLEEKVLQDCINYINDQCGWEGEINAQ